MWAKYVGDMCWRNFCVLSPVTVKCEKEVKNNHYFFPNGNHFAIWFPKKKLMVQILLPGWVGTQDSNIYIFILKKSESAPWKCEMLTYQYILVAFTMQHVRTGTELISENQELSLNFRNFLPLMESIFIWDYQIQKLCSKCVIVKNFKTGINNWFPTHRRTHSIGFLL